MKPNHTLSLITLLLFAIQCTLGQISENKGVKTKSTPLAYIEQHTIKSIHLEQDVAINVFLPETYHSDSDLHTYPLIVLLENEFFYQITGIVKHLSSVSSMPQAIVISFPNDFEKFYAPKVYTNNSDFWPKSWEQMPFDGDPNVFTSFLKEELFTHLSEQYRIANYRMIMGTSPTSTFPLHAFCKEPNLFQAHIAIAAGDILGMGYISGETFSTVITKNIQQNPDRKASLYIASAQEDVDEDPNIGKNIETIERQITLIKSQNLKFKAEVFDNESHYGVVLPAFIAAMETFFPKEKWNPDFRNFEKEPGNTLKNISAYYQDLSNEYGYTVLPKAERWNSGNSLRASANRLFRQKRFKESIEVYQRLVTYRPKSAETLSTLASALEANNELKQALEAQKKAIALAKQHNSNHLQYYTEHMEEIASKIEHIKE